MCPRYCWAIAVRLRQILVNLAGNAVKFTAAGEVSIRVKQAAAGDADVIRFEISDTGIGIPEDKRHLLFHPFSQVDASTSRQLWRHGLGLSIVRMLVDMMGGERWRPERRGPRVLLLVYHRAGTATRGGAAADPFPLPGGAFWWWTTTRPAAA